MKTEHKKIGLFFGTFNPIHVGHLIIANHMVEYTDLSEVWLVVSPQNPHKQKSSILKDFHRLAMVKEAIQDNIKLKASNIEFDLPKPSFTVNTLVYLEEKYPTTEFVLIMGEDNLRSFPKWKNHEEIIKKCELYVYPRVLTENETSSNKNDTFHHPKVKLLDVPVMKISASFIRSAIRNNKDYRYLLTEPVYQYVKEMHFYKN